MSDTSNPEDKDISDTSSNQLEINNNNNKDDDSFHAIKEEESIGESDDSNDDVYNLKNSGGGGNKYHNINLKKGEGGSLINKDSKHKLNNGSNASNIANNPLSLNNINSLINKQQSIAKLNIQAKQPLTLQSINSNHTTETYLLPPIHYNNSKRLPKNRLHTKSVGIPRLNRSDITKSQPVPVVDTKEQLAVEAEKKRVIDVDKLCEERQFNEYI